MLTQKYSCLFSVVFTLPLIVCSAKHLDLLYGMYVDFRDDIMRKLETNAHYTLTRRERKNCDLYEKRDTRR